MKLPTNNWKNRKGTGDDGSPSGSWKEYWIKKTGKSWPKRCTVSGCSETPKLGAHVFQKDNYSQTYIIPMCYTCNQREDYFGIDGGTNLAKVD